MIQLAIADSQAMFRQAICQSLSSTGLYNFLAEVETGSSLLEEIQKANKLPDLCILEINLSGMNGFEILTALKKTWPTIKTLVLTVYNSEFVNMNLKRHGANGYLTKDSNQQELHQAIQSVIANEYYFPENLKRSISRSTTKPVSLTAKEVEFLYLSSTELTYKEIAQRMGVSNRTIDSYRDSLLEKLNLKCRIGLATYALENGIAYMRVAQKK